MKTVPKKYGILLPLLLLFFFFNVASGNENTGRKHFYGTYLGIHMGNINQYDITPMAGYVFTPKLRVALTGKYQFYRSKQLLNVFDTHIYGTGLLVDYFLVENLDELLPFRVPGGMFLHAETELLSLERQHFGNGGDAGGRFWHPVYLAGGGFRYQTGEDRFVNLAVLFELDINGVSLYPPTLFRIGLFF